MAEEDGTLRDVSSQTGGKTAASQSQAAPSPVTRRSVVRRLGVSSALAVAGLVAISSPAEAETLARTQPRRLRLSPQTVGDDAPPSEIVNRGYVDRKFSRIMENVQTGNYTLALSDGSKVVAIDSSSDRVVTVPSNASTPFPVGSIVIVYRAGTGKVTVAAASGVTLRNQRSVPAQFADVSLRKRAADEWVILGGGS